MTNTSGINPIEHKVLIDPSPVSERIGSILLPDPAREKEKFAQTKGRIVAASPHAFTYVTAEEWAKSGVEKPGAGSMVLYAKYAGVTVKGTDGKDYLIINDQDITATIEE